MEQASKSVSRCTGSGEIVRNVTKTMGSGLTPQVNNGRCTVVHLVAMMRRISRYVRGIRYNRCVEGIHHTSHSPL